MHYNLTKILLHDFYNIKNNIPTLYSYPALTYSSTLNIFSGHINLSEFKFCKPNLKRSLIMLNQPDASFLVDTNEIRSQQKTCICLTPPWHNWAGGGSLTTVTKRKHPSGLTSTRANRPAMSSSKRYPLFVKKT